MSSLPFVDVTYAGGIHQLKIFLKSKWRSEGWRAVNIKEDKNEPDIYYIRFKIPEEKAGEKV